MRSVSKRRIWRFKNPLEFKKVNKWGKNVMNHCNIGRNKKTREIVKVNSYFHTVSFSFLFFIIYSYFKDYSTNFQVFFFRKFLPLWHFWNFYFWLRLSRNPFVQTISKKKYIRYSVEMSGLIETDLNLRQIYFVLFWGSNKSSLSVPKIEEKNRT